MRRAAQKKHTSIFAGMREYVLAHKRCVVLVSMGIVLAIATAVYVWVSVADWRSLATEAQSQTGQIESRITQLSQKKHDIHAVKGVADDTLHTVDHLCDVSPLIEWQRHIVEAADSAHVACVHHEEKLAKAEHALRDISKRIDGELALSTVFSTQHADLAALEVEAYDAHRQLWQKFSAKVEKVPVDASLESTKKSAAACSKEIAQAYKQLSAADKKENRSAFDEAVVDVQKGYSKLGEVQNRSVESYSKLVVSLQQSVDDL